MIYLILGLLLWSVPHAFKRLAPEARAKLGNPFAGVVATCVVGGIVLMVIGYRAADFIPVWTPPIWAVHVNNLLVLIAVVLLGAANSKSRLRGMMRHPMLTGVLIWAVAHLLVNGDAASLVLFGGLAVWAIVEVLLINARQPEWEPPTGLSAAGDVKLAVIAIIVFGVIGVIHGYLGPSPFPV